MAENKIDLTSLAFWKDVFADKTQLLTFGVIIAVVMMIIPLPPMVLDFFQILNIVIALMIMITVIV